ncbi:LptF/LptG family permease [Pelagibacteraceae bacterium]|nr:LptF/LptG family permease [Pelagibacteraceae bacterium]
MNKIILSYIIRNFLKSIFIVSIVIYCFGLILNLFEEIEFFKNIDVGISVPLKLTSIYVPSMMIKIFPFIIFFASMWFLVKIRNNKDLLTLKVYSYSNLKIFFILAFTSFILGWIILFFFNPITSLMAKYYEQTKSNYSRDIDHLITYNKNGLWIKESLKFGNRIISASNINVEKKELTDVRIFNLDKNFTLIEEISSITAKIEMNKWVLNDVVIISNINGSIESENFESYEFNSNYNYNKIMSLFRNFDTMSFLDLIFDYDQLYKQGYNKIFLKQSLHTLMTLPFFLFLMTALASIMTLNTLKRFENYKFIILGLTISVIIFYLKDFSLALGQTDRIPLLLSIWSPVLALSLFTFIGVLQINEK